MSGRQDNAVECPVCQGAMKLGRLYAPEDSAVYWFPDDREIELWFLTGKKVTDQGGVVLGRTYRGLFRSKDRPETWHCPRCRLLITSLEQEETE